MVMSGRELNGCRCGRNQYSRGYNDVLIRGPCSHGRKVIRTELNFRMPGTVSRTSCNDHLMVLKMPEISPSA
jgi:hypothetical protein